MTKRKINKKHKEKLCSIVKKIIYNKYPELELNSFIKQEINKYSEDIKQKIKEVINMPEEVYNYLDNNHLFNTCLKYYNIITYNNEDRSIHFEIDCCLDRQKYKYYSFNEDAKPLYEIFDKFCFDCKEQLQLNLREKEKKFNEIYNNFTNIIYSLKYLEDALEFFNDYEEITQYVKDQLVITCTSIAPINPQSIDFVKNFLEKKDKKVLDNKDK